MLDSDVTLSVVPDDYLTTLPEGATVEMLDLETGEIAGYGAGTAPHEIDTTAPLMQQQIREQLSTVALNLMPKRRAEAFIRREQARALKQDGLTPGQLQMAASPTSHQLNMEDLVQVWQFVPPPDGIDFTIFEKSVFEQNHLAGDILSRIAQAGIKRGTEAKRLSDDPITDDEGDTQSPEQVADQAELEALNDWRDRLFRHDSFHFGMETSSAMFHATGNLFWEIIRDSFDAVQGKPATLDWMITSTMRVMHNHRGYVQYVAGRFTWFNNYTPDPDDRAAGIRIWEQWWTSKGVDVNSDKFKNHPFALTLSAAMPEGVFNPNLTEVFHFKDISLSSKYYGFPRDYRLLKLHALLQFALDWNISLQRNGSPPYVLVFHGELDAEGKKEIREHIRSFKGSNGAGRVPFVNAPPTTSYGGSQGAAPKSGLERVQIGESYSDGAFLNLIRMCLDHYAIHYQYPVDMLITDNSNRASMTAADQQLDDQVVARDHEMWEGFFRQLCKDAGFTRRTLGFVSLDVEDKLQIAQIMQSYMDRGVINANYIRTKVLGEPSRPGGDVYGRAGVWNPENETVEEQDAQAGREAMEKVESGQELPDPAIEAPVGTAPATAAATPPTAATPATSAPVGQAAPDDEIDQADKELRAQLDAYYSQNGW